MNFIDKTVKTFFERLYLVLGLQKIAPCVNFPIHSQPRPFTLGLFLDFCIIVSTEWPLIFLVITIHQVIWPSPGTLLDLARPGVCFGKLSTLDYVRQERSFDFSIFVQLLKSSRGERESISAGAQQQRRQVVPR